MPSLSLEQTGGDLYIHHSTLTASLKLSVVNEMLDNQEIVGVFRSVSKQIKNATYERRRDNSTDHIRSIYSKVSKMTHNLFLVPASSRAWMLAEGLFQPRAVDRQEARNLRAGSAKTREDWFRE